MQKLALVPLEQWEKIKGPKIQVKEVTVEEEEEEEEGRGEGKNYID